MNLPRPSNVFARVIVFHSTTRLQFDQGGGWFFIFPFWLRSLSILQGHAASSAEHTAKKFLRHPLSSDQGRLNWFIICHLAETGWCNQAFVYEIRPFVSFLEEIILIRPDNGIGACVSDVDIDTKSIVGI